MIKIIKCHICKLENTDCQQKCLGVDDVSTLYKEGMTEDDVFPDGFCTYHDCPHNPSGFQCTLDDCVLNLDQNFHRRENDG